MSLGQRLWNLIKDCDDATLEFIRRKIERKLKK
jgi:hypothetical protein